jgi:hypothetical protein
LGETWLERSGWRCGGHAGARWWVAGGGLVAGGLVGWWAGGLVGWWAGGLVGWWAGGLVGWWAGGLVGWWAGGPVGWWAVVGGVGTQGRREGGFEESSVFGVLLFG